MTTAFYRPALLLDKHFPPHGNWQGLSLWRVTVGWLTHILSEADHRMNHVQPWAEQRQETLSQCLGQVVCALISGLTLTEDVNEAFGLRLSDPNYETIAGYILGRIGRMAQVGDEVDAGDVRLRVEAMGKLRIARIRLLRKPPA